MACLDTGHGASRMSIAWSIKLRPMRCSSLSFATTTDFSATDFSALNAERTGMQQHRFALLFYVRVERIVRRSRFTPNDHAAVYDQAAIQPKLIAGHERALIAALLQDLISISPTKLASMRSPGICCKPCPVSARFSASCCSTKSMISTASPGGRILSPLAAWSNVPRNPPANACGTSGTTIGNAHLTWAFSEAAVLFLQRPSSGAKIPRPLGEKAWQRQSLDHPGPEAGPGRLFHAQTPGSLSIGSNFFQR